MDYKRSQEVTARNKWLTSRYRRLKGIKRGYRRLPVVTGG